ncbi:phospholipid transport system substrate-binding protein [Oryzisolibacter propanilivorax]|uniref:Phospholipid transport system substrate-binding protein n=1 Tax=Oryzisolibacter propanilivorax TaxID=1527607 RepID=A0A1G9UXF7_9BURK|nr:ABC transporter substrate-binding protein [Oryzisolibacter propanilivorax]SDM64540.1 phospholipid transport system substrate-binding protein [Oryzisolibacter propanilivorax]
MPMNRRTLIHAAAALAAVSCLPLSSLALAAEEAPDALIKRLSSEVLETARKDPSVKSGNVEYLMRLVDRIILPHVNFRRMTAGAVGPAWRQATPQQQARLQEEFKQLLVRTYAGAVAQISDQTVVVKPLRAAPGDKDVLVRTEVHGRGDPVQLDYRMEKTAGDGAGWKIYNLNVLGVWLVDTYRSQFAQEVNARGIDGLIDALATRNRSNNSGTK